MRFRQLPVFHLKGAVKSPSFHVKQGSCRKTEWNSQLEFGIVVLHRHWRGPEFGQTSGSPT